MKVTFSKVDVQVAATFQSFPGPQVLANYVANNAGIWMDHQLLEAYGYSDKKVVQCSEICYPSTNPGNLTPRELLREADESRKLNVGNYLDVSRIAMATANDILALDYELEVGVVLGKPLTRATARPCGNGRGARAARPSAHQWMTRGFCASSA